MKSKICLGLAIARMTLIFSDPGIVAAQTGPRILRTSGSITALPSAELWQLGSDTELFIFQEKTGHSLSTDLAVDLSQPGDYFPEGTPKDQRGWDFLHPAKIPRGTRVDSFYFHFDNKTYTDNVSVWNYFGCKCQIRVSGSITVARPILGIAMRAGLGPRAALKLSDKELGPPLVDYDEHYLRHFPGVNIADGCGSDHFILSADRRTLTVTNFTDVHHDSFRVITEAM